MTQPISMPSGACGRWSRQGELRTALCVAVGSDEAPPELAREADLTVDGPAGVRGLLEALL